jgi:hypothetical protein
MEILVQTRGACNRSRTKVYLGRCGVVRGEMMKYRKLCIGFMEDQGGLTMADLMHLLS